MYPTKAPGPDGMPTLFYQRMWEQVIIEVVSYCLNILNGTGSVQDINHTNIVLIPKVPNPDSMTHFRPISLCNVLYKVISKRVAGRMKLAIPSLISEEQSAFVSSRLITDNILVAYELLHTLRHKRTGQEGYCALKLDMSKAFDRVNWQFVLYMMRKMGFPNRMIHLISDFISTVHYHIMINGFRYGMLKPARGLRQGDPISPYLFLICAEGLSALLCSLTNRGDISGVVASRYGPRIFHLLFAGDSLIFLQGYSKTSSELEDGFT